MFFKQDFNHSKILQNAYTLLYNVYLIETRIWRSKCSYNIIANN